jgi:hypothetical protein
MPEFDQQRTGEACSHEVLETWTEDSLWFVILAQRRTTNPKCLYLQDIPEVRHVDDRTATDGWGAGMRNYSAASLLGDTRKANAPSLQVIL